MGPRRRELFSDWLIIFGGLGLLVSLFLTWSHQFSNPLLVELGSVAQLHAAPHSPTGWEVYSIADVVLAVLAVGLIAVALVGGRKVRLAALVAAGIALAFALHALTAPPTTGANIFDPSLGTYFPNSPNAGPGETVAIASLGVALFGLAASFLAG